MQTHTRKCSAKLSCSGSNVVGHPPTKLTSTQDSSKSYSTKKRSSPTETRPWPPCSRSPNAKPVTGAAWLRYLPATTTHPHGAPTRVISPRRFYFNKKKHWRPNRAGIPWAVPQEMKTPFSLCVRCGHTIRSHMHTHGRARANQHRRRPRGHTLLSDVGSIWVSLRSGVRGGVGVYKCTGRGTTKTRACRRRPRRTTRSPRPRSRRPGTSRGRCLARWALLRASAGRAPRKTL